jgi:hypothetical protein
VGNLKRERPDLLGEAATDQIAWHRQEAQRAQGDLDWRAASFHWQMLRFLDPTNREFLERGEYAQKCQTNAESSAQTYQERRRVPPPRDPKTDPHLLDLTHYYTGPVTEGLPLGQPTLCGTTFDVRGVVELFGTEQEGRGIHRPEQVLGIAVQQHCQRMQILHTSRRFRVIFDYAHQEMILEPDNLFSLPEEFDMSGLAFVAESGGFRVEHVLPTSPAAEAGIQPGDFIEGINERRTVGMGVAELRGLFRQAGGEYDLSVRRGGESNKSRLRLRRLI